MTSADPPHAECWQPSLRPATPWPPQGPHTHTADGMGTGTRSSCRLVTSSRDG